VTPIIINSNDLLADRQGQLSNRQQARREAARAGLKTGLAFFVVVMLGTIGLIVYFSFGSGTVKSLTDPDSLTTLAIVTAVIGLVLVLGLLSSRKHLAATKHKIIQIAEGEALPGKIRPDSANFELKIGKSKIRLLTLEQLEAFEMGTSYRVYYLSGMMPTILSAEVVGPESEAGAFIEQEQPLEQDSVVLAQKKARRIVALLAILVLSFPLIVFIAFQIGLPPLFQAFLLAGLFAVGFLFVFWARR